MPRLPHLPRTGATSVRQAVGPTRVLQAAGLAVAVGLAASFVAPDATAQNDVNPPLQNVLLLVDTSGSMEYRSVLDTTTGKFEFPDCGAGKTERSRWIELIEVLTGGVDDTDYQCYPLDRSSADFQNEFTYDGAEPYDLGYQNPYHRLASNGCVAGPSTASAPTNPFEYWGIGYHVYNDQTVPCSNFEQSNDGLLDSFRLLARFGLMTFDTLPDSGRGHTTSRGRDTATGVAGNWSYYGAWTGGSPVKGWPKDCSTANEFEVGARNASAPAWEGKMVNFGDPDLTGSQLETKNDHIQEIILATRPFGGTPVAGMLDDARTFLYDDTSDDPEYDPLDSTKKFGPSLDPYVQGGCRKNTVILLTDGKPNLDLRPYCDTHQNPVPTGADPAGHCPYEEDYEIARDLHDQNTDVYVIGFALDEYDDPVSGAPVKCDTLTSADLDPDDVSALCNQYPANDALQACCTLNRIAFYGGTEQALFANDKALLRSKLNEVLSVAIDKTTSRTQPVFASGGGAGAVGGRYFTSFVPRKENVPWEAVIERQRIECIRPDPDQPPLPEIQTVEQSAGDDFVHNVEKAFLADQSNASRAFYTVIGQTVAANVYSRNTIRPTSGPLAVNSGGDDGLGTYTWSSLEADLSAADLVTAVTPQAADIDASCSLSNANQCKDQVFNWIVGLDNGTDFHRCKSATECALIGDIYHSTPVVVGPPSASVPDESYSTFASANAGRKTVMYTSTNDGFLHAFDVNVENDSASNELWAFMPPAVLPSVESMYPNVHQIALDGAPVVRDVPANLDAGSGQYRLERNSTGGTTGAGTWRTILVQSFGAGQGGYFALDVTDPDAGPTFLWQLTRDDSGNPMFGSGGGTPLITSLFMDDPDDSTTELKEVAVAVLPGGTGKAATGTCPRLSTWTGIDPLGAARTSVKCWDLSDGETAASRSVTIVRLDNGKVLRSFRPALTDGPPAFDVARFTATDIDSPITGTPAAFPGGTGTVADRIFIGDADGGLWRINVASPSPGDWSMNLFFDTFSSQAPDAGQPIVTAPVLSSEDGNITLAVSTGDQDVLTAAAGQKNYIWSLTELEDGFGGYTSKANWFWEFDDGERVAGPISLFNSALYFSAYAPESDPNDKCGNGGSTIYGMHYTLPNTGTAAADGGGGEPQLPDPTDDTLRVQAIDATTALSADGATIFGVGVARLPTCSVENDSQPDDFFGTGTRTTVTDVNPGKFQLIMQTGSAGTAVSGGQTNVATIDLPAPSLTPSVQSWAAILE